MKHLVKNSLSVLFCAAVFFVFSFANADDFVAKEIPLGRDFLKLSNKRWIWLMKTGQESTRAMIGRGTKSDKHAIWFRDYKGVVHGNSWDYAYFVYLKPNHLIYDLDGDGEPEVGIATFDYGNSVIRDVMIFTVKNNQLQFVKNQGPFNLEADLSLHK